MDKKDERVKKIQKNIKPQKEAIVFALIYGFIGIMWIFFSDRFLQLFVNDFQVYTQMQIYKGWFYVLITTFLLYVLIYKRGMTIKGAFDKLRDTAYIDSLTNLPNKSALIEEMEKRMEREENFYLAYIDLDNFRFINDTLGHRVGDDFLKFISDKLNKAKKKEDFVARLGGDEFGIVISTEDKKDFEERMSVIIDSFGKFWEVQNHQFFISLSIGVVRYPDDGLSTPTLYKNANIAMNKGKKSGKNIIVYFEEVYIRSVTDNVVMANELHEAIINNELVLYYQPSYILETGEIEGIEALIRWKSKKRGFVSPEAFIPIAEETGQIFVIDRWVFGEVLKMKGFLESQGITWNIGVNLSSKTLMGEVNFLDFMEMFSNYDVDFSGITVEITETAIITDISLAHERLKQLREIGLRVALDDFGTGFSSLNHLKNLPIDIVKLDRSFIGSIAGDNREGMIIKAIITLSKDLGFKVIAEGIETKEQLDYLKKNGCSFGQGYLLHYPDMIENILKENNK